MSDSFESIVGGLEGIDWEDPRVSLGDEDIDPLGERSLIGQGLLRSPEELSPENQAQTDFNIDPNRDYEKFCGAIHDGLPFG